MNARAESWVQANQRHLLAALDEIRRRLSHAPPAPSPQLPPLPGAPSSLDALCAAFSLSRFERALLLLCAGVELDASFADGVAAAQAGGQRQPTFALALAALEEAHWSALAPTAPLRRYRLIELLSRGALATAPVRIDERVLHCLTGVDTLDEQLLGILRPAAARPDDLMPSQRAVADRASALLAAEGERVVQLCGRDPCALRAAAVHAASQLGLRLLSLAATDVPAGAAERETVLRLCEREAILSGAALHLDADDVPPEASRAAAAFVDQVAAPLVVTAREPLHLRHRAVARLDLDAPRSDEQEQLWRAALGPLAATANGAVERVVAQFTLSAPAIRAAARAAASAPDGDLGAALWSACSAQAQPRLAELAQRLEPTASGWDELVLPEAERAILQDLVAQVRQRRKVYEEWGFAKRSRNGLGVSALFAGPSGTGKTMAAEILAHVLQLQLYRIDLSQVVSKYIGETEKNLRRVFDAADDGGAILLFDEADALFGKRSEVKDGHDRFANIEVGYLLQRMEAYRGLAILTTNMRDALDSAFLRRIRFVVQFPFPAAAHRAEIWRRIFPAGTPTDGLDVQKLARLHVAGGGIRNIALNAAFLAADAGEPVRMAHLLRAARAEMAKHDRTLGEAEVGEWR